MSYLKSMSLGIICVLTAFDSGTRAWAQNESVRPGINERFLDPDAKVKEWVERFEGESREVFDRREQIADALQLKPGMNVADVGAGTGLFTRLMAERVGKQGKVYAVDIAPKFLEHIDSFARKLDQPQTKTVLGTDDSPNLPENSIDLVFTSDTYHHFEFPHRMMTAIHKALKPKGRVIIVDFIREEGKSSEWTLEHVRAGQDVVEQEIIAAGFKKVKQIDVGLRENYFLVFEKAETPQAEKEIR
jgi:ubiquinone/menaquinone biosynthesis C-methylase UbiE